MLIIIQVEFNSPDSKQPELALAGFVLGFTIEFGGSSFREPNPFGSTEKLEFVQMFTASWQSSAVIGAGGGGGHATHEMVADHPACAMIASDMNTSVIHVEEEVRVRGLVQEKGLPGATGDNVFGP